MESSFFDIAAVLAIAAGAGMAAQWLRQPLIVVFIGVGIVVGPSGLDLVDATGEVDLLAELGIAVLLFLVGLKLDLHLVRVTGRVAVATGLGQIAFTLAIGFALARVLGMPPAEAFYVAVALTFSSTIIIVKLLSDKRELDELHGRIAVGYLIVQDLVVILAMILLTAFGNGGDNGVGREIAEVIGKGLGFLVALGLLMRWVLPGVLDYAARNRELLMLSAVAWAVGVAAVAERLDLGTEVGAFLAGVALASTPFREAIGARLISLRDFLLLFFFIELGSDLDLALAGERIPEAVVLSLFVLVGKPVIVMAIMGVMGYKRRVGFFTGLTAAQISEFSLIFIALALSLGNVDSDAMGLVTMVGLITIGISTYLIVYARAIFDRVGGALAIFERAHLREVPEREERPLDAIVFGLGRYGSHVLQRLIDHDARVIAVDFDPAAIGRWHRRVEVLFGDAEDFEFIATLPLAEARSVVNTAPSVDTSRTLVHALREAGFEGTVVVTAHTEADARRLGDLDALVVLPFAEGVGPVVDLVRRSSAEAETERQAPDGDRGGNDRQEGGHDTGDGDARAG